MVETGSGAGESPPEGAAEGGPGPAPADAGAEGPRAEPGASADASGRPASGVGGFLYRTALAGVGAVVAVQEELESLLGKRSEREGGEASAEAAEAPAGEASEPSEEEPAGTEGTPRTVSDQIDATIQRLLHSVNVPTRDDVDGLHRRIDELTERVARLRERERSGRD